MLVCERERGSEDDLCKKVIEVQDGEGHGRAVRQ